MQSNQIHVSPLQWRIAPVRSLVILGGLLLLVVGTKPAPGQVGRAVDFLAEEYENQHDSPAQQKFEKIAPMPAGVVYIQRPGEGEEDIREHFRTMRELGYTNLKGIMAAGDWSKYDIQRIALEEGLIPWWYGQGGWEAITPELLDDLGISQDLPMDSIRNHPRMRAHQKEVMRERIDRAEAYADTSASGKGPDGSTQAFEPTIGGTGKKLTEKGWSEFYDWLPETYASIDAVNRAYNFHHAGLTPPGGPFTSWADLEERFSTISPKEYRHFRDIFRFKADHSLENNRQIAERFKEIHPHAPFRGGGEMGLFLPQAWYTVDMEGIAEVMTDYGTFYPSMHFSWHFSRVDHEVERTSYMQASLARDYFKGGWAAAWESTGGPQQFSGSSYGKGFTVDDGRMTQFVLSHLAAGFRGFGLWAWSARTAGWETGEYSLLDRNNNVTPRARRVGKISQAMQAHRDELWDAKKEPVVGVFTDWDNDAVWAAMSFQGREEFIDRPMEARVGASRALINANVPFEYVTDRDLRNGLAARYEVIYLPAMLSLDGEVLELLTDYVEQGGRVVMDMPSAYFDEYAALFDGSEGSAFEQLFGTELEEFQYSGTNTTWTWDGLALDGFVAGLEATDARVLGSADRGAPLVTEHQHGQGSAVLLGYEASLMCFEQGAEEAEERLVRHALGDHEPRFEADGGVVYRLAAPKADHYFLINTGEATTITLQPGAFSYQSATDLISGESVPVGGAYEVGPDDGRWLRFEK
jgi:beta-galactosidase